MVNRQKFQHQKLSSSFLVVPTLLPSFPLLYAFLKNDESLKFFHYLSLLWFHLLHIPSCNFAGHFFGNPKKYYYAKSDSVVVEWKVFVVLVLNLNFYLINKILRLT